MAQPTKPPIHRKDPWPRVNPWGNSLPNLPSTNSAARDFYPHLRSKFDPPPQPKPKGK
jgi:hypothetical protein